MDAQIFQFKDPEKWEPEFGGEIATLMKEFVERKLAPLRIAVANLEAKNAILSAEIAAHRSVKYMGVHKPGWSILTRLPAQNVYPLSPWLIPLSLQT